MKTFAQKQTFQAQSERRGFHLLPSSRIVCECVGEVLEKTVVLFLAVCLCVVLAGSLWFLIQKPLPGEVSVTAASSTPPDLTRTDEALWQGSFTLDYPTGSFIIRVGSFRDASNARRVVDSLEQKGLEVRTRVSADGLNVIAVGPYPDKNSAENAAGDVREIVGLAPLVVQQSLR
jgi:hypothetical protein